MNSVCFFAVLLTWETVLGFINNNRSEYIIDVTTSCPDSPNSDAVFTLLADVPAYASATCRGENMYDFVSLGDGITFRLDVGFNSSHAKQKCVFQKKQGIETYIVLIEVGWGEPKGFLLNHKEQYQVSCAYGKKATSIMPAKPVDVWLISPEEKQEMVGENTNSNIELRVINVIGDPFFSSLPFGRWVQLEAISDGFDGEQGIRVLSCTARNDHSSYAVLRAGCGDGVVFEKNAGFQTRGLRAFSPYFQGFRLKGNADLSFVCNFTLCESNCDGNSCPVETKRSLEPSYGTLKQMLSDAQDVSDDPEILLLDNPIPPPVNPPNFNGKTDLIEHPIQPVMQEFARRPSVMTWVVVMLIMVVMLLLFSTILQICIEMKKSKSATSLPKLTPNCTSKSTTKSDLGRIEL